MHPPLPIVVCDDSALARKQMVRALSRWPVAITEARHGLEALEAIRAGKGDLLFLDLNMPIMDGYQVLERIRARDLPTLTLVVSGDIQPEAKRRVVELGALGFIHKPIDTTSLTRALSDYGLDLGAEGDDTLPAPHSALTTALTLKECYQELANVAMGQAANLLARLLGVFIQLPVPRVRLIEAEEIATLLAQLDIESDSATTLCQGFIGPAVAGEALLIFDSQNRQDVARLLRYEGELTPAVNRELTLDMANILISAFLSSLGQQLDIRFNQTPPVILGTHYQLPDAGTPRPAEQTLMIELEYRLEGFEISCNLLLLFTEDSIDALNERTKYL